MANNIFDALKNAASTPNNIFNNLADRIEKRVDSTAKAIQKHNETTLTFPYGSDECKTQNGIALAQKLQAIGFVNITMIAKNDLKGGMFDRKKDGIVTEVLLNGKSSFWRYKGLKKDTPIVISFHSIKGMYSSEPYLLPVPEQYSQIEETATTTAETPALTDNTSVPRFCSYCGSPITAGSRFCSSCGKSL